jgi:predicted metal-dependent phosphoesterase TrpH
LLKHVGSRWWKVDFHAHSPGSFDFGAAKEGEKSTTTTSYAEWLQAYMDAGIDAVVITDHNGYAGIDLARQALFEMSGNPRFRELALLAGVELTVAGGIHLLGIFDLDTDTEVIRKVIDLAGYEGTYGSSTVAGSNSLSTVCRLIHERGGMAIPAHADKHAGVLMQTGTGLAEVEAKAPIFAIETTNPATTFERPGYRKLVRVLGSDAHHLDGSNCPEGEEAKFPGSHFTWVKMESPSLEGIRNAISDGSSSVIPSDGVAAPAPIHSKIRRIAFGSTVLDFNPWLNAIIGGRGVGKSTAVEFLRLTLDRVSDLPQALTHEFQWFSPQSPSGDSKRAWTDFDSIEVTYEKDSHIYLISWRPGGVPSVCEQVDGEWVAADGDVRARFPARIYSQKQIFELSKDPQAILDILDASTEVNASTWQAQHQGLIDEYQQLLAAANTLRDKVVDEPRLKGNIQDLDRRIKAGESLSQSADVQTLQRLEGLSVRADVLIESFEAHSNYISEVASKVESWKSVDHGFFSEEPNLASALHSSDIALSDAKNTIASIQRRLTSALQGLQNARVQADLETRIADLQSAIAADAGQDSAGTVLSALVDISTWKADLEEEKKRLEDVQVAKNDLATLEPKVALKRKQLVESRVELSRRRKAYIQALRPSTPNLDIVLSPMGNSPDLEGSFRRLLKKERTFNEAFSGEGLFKGLPDGRDPKFPEKVEELKEILLKLARGLPQDEFLKNRKIDPRLLDHIRGLSRRDLEDLDLWFPSDRVHVRYRSEDKGPWVSIAEGSPGQRTAALLAFVLSVGTEPLILDQPEDDLENQLITSLVVGTLRSIKQWRQVIVVTHNANIVVNGNADNVVVLHREGAGTSVRAHGALEKQTVRDAVCEIMEGGEPAFRSRFERLGIKLPTHIGALIN